jgi:glycosyltransferase involved in cell wall biosynthesis
MFRIIEQLEHHGHTNRVYVYDRYHGDLVSHAATIRHLFPKVRGEIGDATQRMAPCDAVFATAWPTAYVVRNSALDARRFYLVQDFEPSFYPAGTESLLAETTYRFGFHGVAIGAWLAEKLTQEFGMDCTHFEFGCDTSRYFLTNTMSRQEIVFYARRGVHRRGFELGILALELFSRWHPKVRIHLFGEPIRRLPFPFQSHGVMSPDELNVLYNRCAAGLSLSLTNISLIPLELLGAGCIPVVNDAPHNRGTVKNPYVKYASATPEGLAKALSKVITSPSLTAHSAEAAESVLGATWDQAGVTVERVLRRLCSSESASVLSGGVGDP